MKYASTGSQGANEKQIICEVKRIQKYKLIYL